MPRLLPPGRNRGDRSATVALVLLLSVSPMTRGQDSRSPARPAPAPAGPITVGTLVVLKAPDLRVRAVGDGRPAPIDRGTGLRVERGDGTYLMVSSPDGRHGWVGGAQVIALDRALEHFEQAIAQDPKNADAYRMRGRLRAARGELDAALADFDQAIQLDPERARAYLDRGGLLTRRGQLDRAITDLDAAIRLDPDDAEAHAARGDARAARGDFPRAVADYTEALRRVPGDPDLFARRGLAWMKRHDTRQAIADFDTAIELDPRNASLYLQRGLAWSRRGDHDPAMEDYDEAIRLAPTDAEAYVARATEWEKDLKLDRALDDYQQAIAIDPKATAAYEGRGRIWRKRGEYDRVVANFAEFARIMPDDPLGHRALAWMLATCDRDDIRDGRRALAEAKAACELTKWTDPACIEALAAACAEVGDFDAAVGWQSRAVSLFTAKIDRVDRRLAATKTRDADLSHRLYLYKKRLPYHERSDRAVR